MGPGAVVGAVKKRTIPCWESSLGLPARCPSLYRLSYLDSKRMKIMRNMLASFKEVAEANINIRSERS
jgi:hypothetical protein